jgi:hypothetical protein
MAPVIMGPRVNRRVTCDLNPSNDRSEASLAANPLDPYNMVGASKRFVNPQTYDFSLATYATFDGGLSWVEGVDAATNGPLQLLSGWGGTSDPAVAWDNAGNAYLVALAGTPLATGTLGIAVYRSSDGGRSWSPPNFIHPVIGDDKQSAEGDYNPASPHYGNVYAAWDGPGGLLFARTTDHGISWKGIGTQPVGSSLSPASFAPEVNVAPDGTVYILFIVFGAQTQVQFVKSTDGGNSFSAPAVAASGITVLPGHLPGGNFRTPSVPTGAAGSGNVVMFAWPDYRDGVARIYYRRSTNAGATWQGPANGQLLLTGTVASAANQHEFQPQMAATPTGEIGCTFYYFGPKTTGATTSLIDVQLAVSTNNGNSFPNRVTVSEAAWDPSVDAPWAHGNPNVTFIGDYFGLGVSKLGFFPFWTDTRTGVQEIYTARIAVRPADVYIRDSSSDTGTVPSPGNHWEAPDLVVRRQQDGATNFVDQDLLRDGVTDHYVYGRVTNHGPNPARSVRLAVTVGNYPSLMGLPGSEFRYPQDWYPGDWSTGAIQARHLFLGESVPVNIPNGATQIVGPILWPAAQIPDEATWHPCLLAEVKAENNDSAGGPNGSDIDADADPCVYGSYFWGNNNICQRNLSYAPVFLGIEAVIEFPFILGSPWSQAQFVELIVDKGPHLEDAPMTLHLEPIERTRSAEAPGRAELVLLDGGRVAVLVNKRKVSEAVVSQGTVWELNAGLTRREEARIGVQKQGDDWRLTQRRATVGVRIAPGQLMKATLRLTTSGKLEGRARPVVRIFQRNDRKQITGGVQLELVPVKSELGDEGEAPQEAADSREREVSGRRRPKTRTAQRQRP